MRQPSRYGWRPADPPSRPVLFVNPRSGDGKAARAEVAERARAKGIEAVILTPGQDLAALAREAVAAGADALGMAGGDGSLAVMAAARPRTGFRSCASRPGRVTLRARRGRGVDRRDVIGALDAFTGGMERRIDTAKVNGRLFLNSVSLGIYGAAVRRPTYRDAKVRTLLETAPGVRHRGQTAPATAVRPPSTGWPRPTRTRSWSTPGTRVLAEPDLLLLHPEKIVSLNDFAGRDPAWTSCPVLCWPSLTATTRPPGRSTGSSQPAT